MKARTKELQFDKQTIKAIQQRDDYSCLYCKMDYHMEKYTPTNWEFLIHDIAHYIPKSKGGLGIMENGIECCRWHHNQLDNGNKGLRIEMLKIAENYLKAMHPSWDKERLVYKK